MGNSALELEMNLPDAKLIRSNISPKERSLREDEISKFNRRVRESKSYKDGIDFSSTHDFRRKLNYGSALPLSSLSPLRLADLEQEKTHRCHVVFGIVASSVMKINSIMLKVEDESAIVNLAVYGNSRTVEDFQLGRIIAIKEPYYKLRDDGNAGICVDNSVDIEFDPIISPSTKERSLTFTRERFTVEQRMEEILSESNGPIDTENLYRQLVVVEGYFISKKCVRALEKAMQDFSKTSNPLTTTDIDADSDTTRTTLRKLVPIISERRPEAYQVFRSSKIIKLKEDGDQKYESGHYQEAEDMFSKALREAAVASKASNRPSDHSITEVQLWQLFLGRSKTRMKLFKLQEAFEDSRASNICAPPDEIKCLLGCVEAMSELGLQKESQDLLSDCRVHFSKYTNVFDQKIESINQKTVLVVGKNEEYLSISAAVKDASEGAEIIVSPGIYEEQVYIDKALRLRCDEVSDYEAIRCLEKSDEETKWAEIRAIGQHGIVVNYQGSAVCHIFGFKVSCDAPPKKDLHAILVTSGNVVIRKCSATSRSGPVFCAPGKSSNVIMQKCAIHNGTQGGILAARGAKITLHQVHCCRNKAMGLELRETASVFLDSCFLYDNSTQGIVVWSGGGILVAKNCEIHSHPLDGILVSGPEARFNECKIFGNRCCGVTINYRGKLKMSDCEIYDNYCGILIKDCKPPISRQIIAKCQIYSNEAGGILDHYSCACLHENTMFNNHLMKRRKRAANSKNYEFGNRKRSKQDCVHQQNDFGKDAPPTLESKNSALKQTPSTQQNFSVDTSMPPLNEPNFCSLLTGIADATALERNSPLSQEAEHAQSEDLRSIRLGLSDSPALFDQGDNPGSIGSDSFDMFPFEGICGFSV